jgi:hypothetical protein
MALSQSAFYANFIDQFNGFCSLNTDGTPKVDGNGVPVPSQGTYPAPFANAYKTYTLTGQVLGAQHGSQNESILSSWLSGPVTGTEEFAQVLANYWATVLIVPGAPAHGGTSVVSVTNDAASKVSAFVAALNATYTTNSVEPIFSSFLENVKNIALSQVTWFVTELMPPSSSPTVFQEKIT